LKFPGFSIVASHIKRVNKLKMKSTVALLASVAFALLSLTAGLVINDNAPSVTVTNGTYIGKYVSEWQQDQFLGIPYAIPPLGPLRFARPKSLNSSFAEARNATEYGNSCYQYGTSFVLSEDCLNLNGMYDLHFGIYRQLIDNHKVIRPAGTTSADKLPVLIWIFGGGLYTGSTADPQYNLSGITHVGQQLGKPIITGMKA
jgi:hypothetical protein